MKLVKSSKLLTATCALTLAMGVVGTSHAAKFSLDAEAFCGDPAMVPTYDSDGITIIEHRPMSDNVAVRLTDVSDDNGPEGAEVGLLRIECLAAVKQGRGKPNQFNFATVDIPDPGFGVIEANCPLDSLPEGATEWKARATASEGDVRRPVSDNCDEIAVD